MPATDTHSAPAGNADTALATRANGALVAQPAELRGTLRGKTVLSLTDLEAKVSHYPDDIRESTRAVQAFFVKHCESNVEQLRGVAVNTLKIERSPEYFSNWIKGYYFRSGGGMVREQGKSEWLAFCQKLIEHDRLTQAGGKLGTIMTGTVRAITNHALELRDVSNPCRITGIAGPTGSQKSASLRHLVAKLGGWPHASLFECTEGMGAGQFKRGLADLFNCKVGNKAGVLEAELGKNLHAHRWLVIDNVQRAMTSDDDANVVLNFIIRMQETKNFPLVLSFTKEWMAGTLLKLGVFEQLVGRMGGASDILVLPDYCPKGDLRTIAAAYNLHDGDEAMGYLTRWSKQPGRIRVVFKRLWRARQFAAADGKERITLDLLREVDTYVPPAEIEEKAEVNA